MLDQLRISLTGIWPLVAKFGLSGLTVAGLLAFAWFSPVFKKTALWLALLVFGLTWAYTAGVRDQSKRDLAKWNAQIDMEIEHAEKDRVSGDADVDRSGDSGLRDDRYNRDNGAGG